MIVVVFRAHRSEVGLGDEYGGRAFDTRESEAAPSQCISGPHDGSLA